eukprot:TRINITY_DN114387_c0_g1_i1.p1 TRINITY_DN114387_c0_g1~~TRINITY_DN114387_c0_g1_i1.p1  ORF type:complete len:447 (+),score=44.60 TRINITY_DN114387_c0_g1_i1:58-1398(+)
MEKTDFERVLSLISEEDFASDEEDLPFYHAPSFDVAANPYKAALLVGIDANESRMTPYVPIQPTPAVKPAKSKAPSEVQQAPQDDLPERVERFSERPKEKGQDKLAHAVAGMQDRLLIEPIISGEAEEFPEFDDEVTRRHTHILRKAQRKLRKENNTQKKHTGKPAQRRVALHPPEIEIFEDEDGVPTLELLAIPEFYRERHRRGPGGVSSGYVNWGNIKREGLAEPALQEFASIYFQKQCKKPSAVAKQMSKQITVYSADSSPNLPSTSDGSSSSGKFDPAVHAPAPGTGVATSFTSVPAVTARGKQEVTANVLRLYHGTLWNAARSIFSGGFRMPSCRSGNEATYAPSGRNMVRPHMFGKGIYFTTNAEKASHFGDTLVVCDVALGRWKPVHEADYGLGKSVLAREGFDSVYAAPGAGGNVFDEYVVFDPTQVTVVGYTKRPTR